MGNKFGVLYSLMVGLLMIVFGMGVVSEITPNKEIVYSVGVVMLLGAFVPREKGALQDAMNPDLSGLATYIGRYRKDIYTKFLNSLGIFNDITGWYGVKDKERLIKLTVQGEPEPFSGVFEPDNKDIFFGDQELKVEKFQRDFQIFPEKYRNSYFSYRRGAGEGANNRTIPFYEFTMNEVIKKLAADINDISVWWGLGKAAFPLFSPTDTYAVGAHVSFVVGKKVRYYDVVEATTAGQSPATHPAKFKLASAKAIVEGLGTKIRNARTSGALTNVASTGLITVDDALDQFRAVWAKAPEHIRREGGVLYTSFSNYEKLLLSFEKVSQYTEKDGTVKYLPLTDKKCELRPVSWKAGSNQLTVSQQSNLIAATDQLKDLSDISAIPQMYHVDFGMSGVIGFGVIDFDEMATNDQV